MTDKKALLIATLEASQPHMDMHASTHELVKIPGVEHRADINTGVLQFLDRGNDCFATYVNRVNKTGEIEQVVTAEYFVGTKEATVERFPPEGFTGGGLDTSEPTLKVWRYI